MPEQVTTGTSPEKRRQERLIALTIAGILTLNYPLLALFSQAGLVFGIPLLYFYLFLAWAIFIALVTWTLEGNIEDIENNNLPTDPTVSSPENRT